MFCQNCGAELAENDSFCSACGSAVSSERAGQRQSETGLIGFSSKISDPAFAAYKRKSVAWSLIFSAILFVIAVIAFPIYGSASGELDWPYSLYYGLGIGTMFVVIALLQTAKKALDKTWDGEVVYKDSYILRERDRNGFIHRRMIYVIKIKKDSGGIKKHKWRNIPGLFLFITWTECVTIKVFFIMRSTKNQAMARSCARLVWPLPRLTGTYARNANARY